MPQKLAGMRMEPPPSPPVASGHRQAARAAAAPPLEPPGVRSVFQGLRPGSPNRFPHAPTRPNSGKLVLPSMMAPASSTLSTMAALLSGTRSLNSSEPLVVVTPAVIWESLMAMGSPWRGPRSSERIRASSAALASLIAWSRVSRR